LEVCHIVGRIDFFVITSDWSTKSFPGCFIAQVTFKAYASMVGLDMAFAFWT